MTVQIQPQTLTRQDFLSSCDPRWCPGCGCFSILRSLTTMFADAGVPREKQVIISGIGCSSRLPYYTSTYGFHTIHGRAPTVAMGVKLANPELSVWMVCGDGDALAIGGNHTMHFLRRNPDMKMMLLNNQIYGLTKGQASPTSPAGLKTKSTPYGVVDNPVRPISLALASGATFVARAHDKDNALMETVMAAAQQHKGAAFIEILMNCVTFNDGAFDHVTAKSNRDDHSLMLQHGEPLLFGADKTKGLCERNGRVEIVELGVDGITLNDILVHDMHAPDAGLAHRLALLEYPDAPFPFGIFRQVETPVYGFEKA